MASKASILALIDSTRVRLGFGREKAFVPTANVRNPHMLEEAEAFSLQLKDFQRAVGDYHRNVQGFMHGMMPLLDSNLPRVWTAVPDSVGLAEPVAPAISHGHPGRVGGDYDGAAIMAHMDTLERSVKEDILAPLRRWQEGLQVARERMKSLDKLRREVDGQRKKFEKKFRRSEQRLRKAYLGAGYGSSSSSDSDDDDVVPRGKLLEDYQRLALHTERQLRAIVESYEDQERLVWEQLSGLVTDAAWLESYAAAAMIKVKEAMQGAALALGPTKQPLPAYRPKPGVPVGVPYGDVGTNVNLIKQFSPRALELASGSLPRGAAILPYQPLRAKRGTATPLLVAATATPGSEQRMLAAQPVPPVQLGASMVPIASMPRDVASRAIRDVERRVAGEGIRVHERPQATLMPGAASPIVSTPTTVGTAAGGGFGGGFSTGGFRDSERGTGFRDTGRDRDATGFRETARDGLGFRDREHQGSAGYRDQGFGSERDHGDLGFGTHRELSLAQGIRDTELAPTAAAAAPAAAGEAPRDRGVLSEAARSAGPDAPAPFARVYADAEGSQGLGPQGTGLGYDRPTAGGAAGERGYAGDRPEYEVGCRADDVVDSYSTPVKMAPVNTTAAPATGTNPPASSSRSPRSITDAIRNELAQAHNNAPTPSLSLRNGTSAAFCSPSSNATTSVNANNLRSFPIFDAAATSPAYPPAARVGGIGSRNGSDNEFQDARSEPYASRGTSATGYEASAMKALPTTGMNGGTARGPIADAPYGAAGSPRDEAGLTKHQQGQAYDRPINSVQ